MNKLVSIITPSYNSSKFIEECVRSVFAQSYTNWELIIVDDCSMDNSKNIILELLAKDKRIKCIFLEKNVGVAEARNIAIRKAKGKYIAFLDSDDLWLSNKLEKQIAFMQEKQIAFSFTGYQIMSEDGKQLKNIVKAPKKMNYSSYLKNTIIGCLTVVIDVERTGVIAMPILRVSEDMALWLQLLKKGFFAYGLDEVLSRYRETSNSLSTNKFKAAKDVWKVYRKSEKLNLFYSIWCFVNYAVNAIIKRV
jgi:teichuronic acid biosynthesis glycosyltransferase TuaG